MATVDELKARIQEEVDAFAEAVYALLEEITVTVAPPVQVLTSADEGTSATPRAPEPAAPSGVNEAQQNIIEPTPDSTPEEESEDSSPTSPSPEGGSAPDTTGL